VKVKGQRRNDIELKVLNVRENCTDISMTRGNLRKYGTTKYRGNIYFLNYNNIYKVL